MSEQSRREFIIELSMGIGAVCLLSLPAFAEGPCSVNHPIIPPNKNLKGQCPNCGMVRPMWARTWMTFENSEGKFQVCSFHCLAEMALKAGEDPRNVKVALYKDPDTMIPAERVHFVVGSRARGTMTMTSKLAFASKVEADKFAESCSGKVMDFKDTLEIAKIGIQKENKMIVKNRLEKGKIVEPVDNKEKCPVCDMYPARHPKNKCQIQTRDKTVYHFCSTQCLFNFLENSAKYAGKEVQPFFIWVVDFNSGDWIGGKTAYYVVGSVKKGPMGKEAFVFDKMTDAKNFVKTNGGKAIIFSGVTFAKIMA
ncbi:MAG: nitrous oxide reductase accessory protein NosL [Desulfobacterales bacterium]|jgi:nitrous oxide reductase accessory protein NosL